MKHLISIEESIKDILLTPLGSRLMLPNYGSKIYELVDKRVDDNFKALLTAYVVQAVHKYETRVKIKKVIFVSKTDDKLTFRLLLDNGGALDVSA